MRKIIALFSLLALLLLAACGQNDPPQRTLGIGEAQVLPNGDRQERTASKDELPLFMSKQDEPMKTIYLAAAQNQDLLRWIPCYCGCAESAGHLNNAQCFYKEIAADGSVTWDDHATRCNTCLEIAVQSITKKKEGLTVKEIRNWVDTTYGNGNYAKPTPTPMP
ncbi:PCYCGC motif-containing (lipo)protein [Thermicanus aegyptius]|uniref:PCYCGC motif-containing (lipo)protein n=1 Tax=Thermicanus aegyptius TaxID=94009 RepID=UPI0004236DEA|nr:PCYCGC motif-containing (lipo)protein [Thermicanus aegyptius]